jgi:hypothetical protein
MKPNIPAIETAYRGHRFRSRTEAKWAVFFDLVGEPFEYEPQGVALSTGAYLPDFWLPRCGMWFEVKGNWELIGDYAKFGELASKSGQPVAIAAGGPGATSNVVFVSHEERGPEILPITLQAHGAYVCAYPTKFARRGRDLVLCCEVPGLFSGGGFIGIGLGGRKGAGELEYLDDELTRAGMSRFEHGEKGAPR